MVSENLNVGVIIASKARPAELQTLIPFLNAQTQAPAQLIFAVTSPDDLGFDPATRVDPNIPCEVIYAAPGLTKQRNAGLDQLRDDIDVVVFFDDDFLPTRCALQRIATSFAQNPDVSGMSGQVLADGIHSQGIRMEDAKSMIAAWEAEQMSRTAPHTPTLSEWVGLYGCNMAMRVSDIETLRFDERLPAYGWLEDLDFGAQLPGRTVITDAFAGVHLGTRSGRETNGARLGYSQMVNPYYIYNKGSITRKHAVLRVLRNLVANLVKSFRPEPWIDRTARLRGNLIGLYEILSGKADPGRIERW